MLICFLVNGFEKFSLVQQQHFERVLGEGPEANSCQRGPEFIVKPMAELYKIINPWGTVCHKGGDQLQLQLQ